MILKRKVYVQLCEEFRKKKKYILLNKNQNQRGKKITAIITRTGSFISDDVYVLGKMRKCFSVVETKKVKYIFYTQDGEF